jgi:hypothetical protein
MIHLAPRNGLDSALYWQRQFFIQKITTPLVRGFMLSNPFMRGGRTRCLALALVIAALDFTRTHYVSYTCIRSFIGLSVQSNVNLKWTTLVLHKDLHIMWRLHIAI